MADADAESKLQALIAELAPNLGGQELAEIAVLNAVDNLSGEYDETEIVDKLRKDVLASSTPTASPTADGAVYDEAAAQKAIDD